MSDVTRILTAIERGDPAAAQELLPLVYEELRRLAAQRLARGAGTDAPGHRPGPRGVPAVGRLRRPGMERPQPFPRRRGRGHAAHPGRQRPPQEGRAARGGLRRVDLDSVDPPADPEGAPADDLLALDEALSRLAEQDRVKAELVKLRYYAGLSVEEAGRALGISRHRRALLGLCPVVALRRAARPGAGGGYAGESARGMRRTAAVLRTLR